MSGLAAPAVFVTRKYDRDGDWFDVHVEYVLDGWLVTRKAGGSRTRTGAESIGAAFVERLVEGM